MLDGRAEVVTYARDPSAFFVLILVPRRRGYKSRGIVGVSTLPEAIEAALDTYMALGTPSDPKPPRRGTEKGIKVFRAGSGVFKHLNEYFSE